MLNLPLSLLGAIAEFERALIKEHQREGITTAKRRGTYLGRPRLADATQVEELKRRASAGEKKAVLAREFGLSRETVYKYLRS